MSDIVVSNFSIESMVEDKVDELITRYANSLCARWNYEASIVDMEMNTMDVAGEDAVSIYDSLHAVYIEKSHLTKHVSDAFHAEVVDGDKKGTKRLKITGPQNVAISNEQLAVLNIITHNMQRTV